MIENVHRDEELKGWRQSLDPYICKVDCLDWSARHASDYGLPQTREGSLQKQSTVLRRKYKGKKTQFVQSSKRHNSLQVFDVVLCIPLAMRQISPAQKVLLLSWIRIYPCEVSRRSMRRTRGTFRSHDFSSASLADVSVVRIHTKGHRKWFPGIRNSGQAREKGWEEWQILFWVVPQSTPRSS